MGHLYLVGSRARRLGTADLGPASDMVSVAVIMESGTWAPTVSGTCRARRSTPAATTLRTRTQATDCAGRSAYIESQRHQAHPPDGAWSRPIPEMHQGTGAPPMKCRGCGGEHDPRVRCEVAARIAGIGIAPVGGVPNAIPNATVVPNSEVARSAAWKKAHPEEYRKYQRELMRSRRAKARAS
jgi:hypothetical protein